MDTTDQIASQSFFPKDGRQLSCLTACLELRFKRRKKVSLLKKGFIIFLGVIALGSTLVCIRLLVQIDGDLNEAYFKARQAATTEQMERSLDGMIVSVGRLKSDWSQFPGVSTDRLDRTEDSLLQLRQRLGSGAFVYEIKGDLISMYLNKELMPWFPYGHIVVACLALMILVAVWPQKVQHNGVRQDLAFWR